MELKNYKTNWKRGPVPTNPNVKKALLKLNFSCNNRCVFCHAVDNAPYSNDETSFAVEKMKKAKEMGIQMVVFSGGESTIRQDFFVLVKAAKTLGLKHGVITNGRMLSYHDFSQKYLNSKPEYVYVSLHGAKASTHNRVTLAASYEQVMAGLRNISGYVPDLTVNMVVTKANMHELKDMVDLILPFSPVRLKFSCVEPKGSAHHQFDDVAPDISESARYVNEVIAYGEENSDGSGMRLGCEGFVPCLIDNYDKYNADLYTDNFICMSESNEDVFYPVDSGDRCFLPACHDCALKSRCQGIYTEYVTRAGGKNINIKPKRGRVPSGFNFRAQTFLKKSDRDCPVAGMPLNGLDAQKNIFLLQGNKLTVCSADTEQFSIPALREIKRGTQQLYLDISKNENGGAGFVDFEDYKKNRIKLKLRHACTACPKLMTCPATFEPALEKGYGAIEARIKEILRKLTGNVLDVGCGSILYRDIFHELHQANKIQYFGVDPDPASANGFKTYRASIEEFEWKPGYFDAALVLRSYNHFYDLKKAFDVIARVLKPGGEILIVENGPSALVQLNGDRKQGVPLAFEHYRNHTSHDALDLLRAHYSFSIVEHLPLVPAHENQWLLRIKIVDGSHFLLKETHDANGF